MNNFKEYFGYIERGNGTIWGKSRVEASLGKSYIQQLIQMAECEGGLFIPRYIEDELSNHEIIALFEAGKIGPNKAREMLGLIPKYNLNKKVLIL